MSKLSRGLFTGAFLAAICLAVAAFMSTPAPAPAQPPATEQAPERVVPFHPGREVEENQARRRVVGRENPFNASGKVQNGCHVSAVPYHGLRPGQRVQGRGDDPQPGVHNLRGVPRSGKRARENLQGVRQQEKAGARGGEESAGLDLQGPSGECVHPVPHGPRPQG
jgi:hypothetical protein